MKRIACTSIPDSSISLAHHTVTVIRRPREAAFKLSSNASKTIIILLIYRHELTRVSNSKKDGCVHGAGNNRSSEANGVYGSAIYVMVPP